VGRETFAYIPGLDGAPLEMTLDLVRGRISCLEITRLGAVRVGINVAVGVGVMEGVGVSEGSAVLVCAIKVFAKLTEDAIIAVPIADEFSAGAFCWHPENSKDATKITNNEI
jgi:hypothetical protein